MPSQQEVRWSQLKIGVIVLVAVVILTTLLFLMTSSSGLGFFSRKLTVTTYFENSAGLKIGAAVNLEGVTIGNVKSIVVTTAPERPDQADTVGHDQGCGVHHRAECRATPGQHDHLGIECDDHRRGPDRI